MQIVDGLLIASKEGLFIIDKPPLNKYTYSRVDIQGLYLRFPPFYNNLLHKTGTPKDLTNTPEVKGLGRGGLRPCLLFVQCCIVPGSASLTLETPPT